MVKRDENRNEIDKINKVEKMSEVQKYMLNILKELVSIFDEHDIKYYMIGGTLLGAIRHKGYIPWDDDIDLAIPRDDYDRFLEIANDILPNSLTLRTYDDESYHHYYFARIVDTRYKILRMGSVKEREEELWIDLFPLDGLPRNTVKRVIHKTRLLTLKVLYHFATFDKVNLMRPNRPFYQRVIIKGYEVWPFKVKKGYKDILDKIDRLLKKASINDSDYYMEFMGSSIPFRETCRIEQYGDGKFYKFEDTEFRGPEDAEYYLRHVYGDYMTLPPEDKRNCHAAKFIKS